MLYAEVAVNSVNIGRPTFSYAIPPDIQVSPGQAVWVPFGEKLLQGVVVELTKSPEVPEVREIAGLVDARPVVSPAQLALARWIAGYYFSALFDALALMLPPGFRREPTPLVVAQDTLAQPTMKQGYVLKVVRGHGEISLDKLRKLIGKELAAETVPEMVRCGFLRKYYRPRPARVKPKFESFVTLTRDIAKAQNALKELGKRAPKQALLLEFLINENKPYPLKEINGAFNFKRATVNALAERGLVTLLERRLKRRSVSLENAARPEVLTLSPAQDYAVQNIKSALEAPAGSLKPSVFLLHGVTGSGKTEVYRRVFEEVVKRGKRALVLVPEISLTPQTAGRFAARFPGRVAVLHSRLSPGERLDAWEGIRDGEFDVVIGPRSALFAPQPDLGLIIIDEEHDPAYKQRDIPPFYHVRDVALKLAELTSSVVILGSATPDVATFYHAVKGDYRLISLPERVTPREGAPLPAVRLVDMRQELKMGNRSVLSRALSAKMKEALRSGGQVILFLNRRGTANFIQCQGCGDVPRCPRCQLPLNYHTAEGKLICHQCNYRRDIPNSCPHCGGSFLFLGAGIQRLEEEVRQAFPEHKILRWDSDTAGGRHAHEELLTKFRNLEADILIGTQVVASGLDLPQVNLVGIVNADTALGLPDFRAGERTFQLLCQVSGRAGRGNLKGEVIIQTYSPEHYAIRNAVSYNYRVFYEEEIEYRSRLHNPPFRRLAALTFSHLSEAACRHEAERLNRLISEERDASGFGGLSLIGPFPAYIPRLRGRFRWQIILRFNEMPPFLARLRLKRGWTLDIDPVGLV